MIARPMLASIFIVGAAAALKSTSGTAAKADPVTSRLVPLAQKAGLALATGRAPRLSSAVLAASLIPTTAAGHRYWEQDDEATRGQQRLHFFKNVAIIGGLIIAAGDTEGRPGVAWRARHAAKDARREAKLLKAKVS
jgi:uncharacterized membrane protein YphA (DoxX/SURF4 family)